MGKDEWVDAAVAAVGNDQLLMQAAFALLLAMVAADRKDYTCIPAWLTDS